MKQITTALIITSLAIGVLGITTPAIASEHGRHEMHMMHDKGQGMHHGSDWKSSLSDKQAGEIAGLKLDYKKKVYPVKTKIKQAKVELALLITSDKPNQKVIDTKIDEIVKLKAEKLRHKAKHKIEVRKVLNAQQRVMFDMKVLKKAYHGKKRHHYRHH